MGRIKSAAMKKIAKKVVAENPEEFNKDFEKNKRILRSIIAHKKTRNAVAGYVTRLKKR
jgi:ribosomal protein S17E